MAVLPPRAARPAVTNPPIHARNVPSIVNWSTMPIGSIIVFMIVAIIAGILAAIFPARRAAKLNVLDALQYE